MGKCRYFFSYNNLGTYIKEFVHGDLERTLPNFGSLINKKIDILQLDVGSLK
jgi:tRNA pseudouridine synthase 10